MLLAHFKVTFSIVCLGQVHFNPQVVWQELFEHLLVKVNGELVFLFTDIEMGLVHKWLIQVRVGVTHELKYFLRVLCLVEESKDIG